jgi:hypothetical protein
MVQGLARCGGEESSEMYSKGEDGAHLHHQKNQICLGRKGKCRSDSTGINLKVHGVDFIEYYENLLGLWDAWA